MESKVEVFALPLGERRLLYAPLHGVSALVNQAAVDYIANGRGDAGADLRELRRELMGAPEFTPSVRAGPFLPDYIGLLPTRGCNMACRYCGFGGAEAGTAAVMTPGLAEAALRWFAACLKRAGRESLALHFFGGEPMLAAHLVEDIVGMAGTIAEEQGLGSHVEITTNGFFGADTAAFLAEEVDSVVLSFDGPRDIQDLHRPLPSGGGSFETVRRSAEIVSKGKAELSLRACVSDKSVARMAETADWFCRNFHPRNVCFEPLRADSAGADQLLAPPDPWDFARGFIEAQSVIEGHGAMAVFNSADTGELRVSFCPVGLDVPIVSPDGSVAGCYLQAEEWRRRGLDMSLGRLDEHGAPELDDGAVERLRSYNVNNYRRCRDCFCRRHCAGGCHVHNSHPGSGEAYTDFCIETRLITLFRILRELDQDKEFDRLLTARGQAEHTILSGSDRVALKVID